MLTPRFVTAAALAALVLTFALPAPDAQAATFVVKSGGKNRVVFFSKAPIESFEGKTSRLEGVISLDPSAVGDSFDVHLEVDLASLDTGIAKRNQHMRDNHLETAKYPKAIFDGVSVLGPKGAVLAPGKPASFEIEGTFALHGVTRRMRVTAKATFSPGEGGAGGTILFTTKFPVTLSDYNISRPQFLFMKLAETQDVTVTGIAVATAQAAPASSAP